MNAQSSIRRIASPILAMFGVEDRVRHLYWRARLWRTHCTVEMCGVQRQFWAVDQQIQGRLQGGSEREQLEEFLRNIREGDIVWDVGSFVGLYAVFAAHFAGRSGTVVAFEPDRTAFGRLDRNCRLNEGTNIRLMPLALSDQGGDTELFVSRKHVGTLAPADGPGKRQRVHLDTGDHLVAEGVLPAPNVLKIDVEGAEYQVLRGMQKTLSDDQCRYLLLEVHPSYLQDFGSSLEDIRSFLIECGFSVRSEMKRGKESHWIARK